MGDTLKFHYRCYVNTLQTHLCKFVFFCVVAGYFVQRFMQIFFLHIHNGKCETSTGWKFVSVKYYNEYTVLPSSVFYVFHACYTRPLNFCKCVETFGSIVNDDCQRV